MDEGTVREVLAEHGLAAGVVRPLGGGLDHATFLVDDELVVRLVREEADRARVVPEARLLAAVAGAVPLPVPEPLVVDAGRGCLAYRRLPGRPVLGLPGVADHAVGLGEALGRFLAALHRLPTDLAEPDDAPLREWLEEARALYPGIRTHVPAHHRAAVEAFLAAPPPAEGTAPVLTHNDLGAEHVLVDDAWQVTGVVDWGDAAVTDPARDLGLLLRDLGPRGLDAALTAYGPGIDAADLERAAFHARCATLADLAYGLGSGLTDYTAQALTALGRLFPSAHAADGGDP
ncbi:phosphotransferase family protein [Georgenia wutianyii]|uniref:phosphotransferase family protein n=1 Tax=Georgenia wutianyii TaxID=2585135 RepID=UPI001CB702FC|nr:phosphotransferase [Georgenia wutianyii]